VPGQSSSLGLCRRRETARRNPLILFAVALLATRAGSAAAADLEDGEQLFHTGQYAECIDMAAAEIERGNYLEPWRRLKIDAEMAIGAYDAALASVEQALGEFPTSLALRMQAHAVYQINGQAARAATEFEMIERLAVNDPRRYSSPSSRLALGRYFLRAGADARQVLEIFFDPITQTWPDFLDAHLASAELSLEKYDSALAAETLVKGPEALHANPQYYYLLARAYATDDPEAAAAALQSALELNPRHVRSLLLEVDRRIDAEQYAEAEELLDAIDKVNPREPLAWAYRAVLAHLNGDAKAEEAAREKALADWATNPEVDHTVGR
jgi:tetratricopeptide (TPR) repeat protein